MPDLPPGFTTGYIAELLFREKPAIRKRSLFESLRRRFPRVVPLDGDLEKGLLAFVHPEHLIELKDGRIPAQFVVMETEKPVDLSRYETALQQSWSFPGARNAVKSCTSNVMAMEMMATWLPYRDRIELFQSALAATLETVDCAAVYWWPTEQIVDPKRYLESFDDPGHNRFFLGALNVRLFNIEGTAGDIVMDTLGLAALGLPDLQCHFHGLDCNDVARLLHNVGLYVFENGDVIENGHTIDGIITGEKWRCQHEMALIGPERMVIDVNPGGQFAAGSRN